MVAQAGMQAAAFPPAFPANAAPEMQKGSLNESISSLKSAENNIHQQQQHNNIHVSIHLIFPSTISIIFKYCFTRVILKLFQHNQSLQTFQYLIPPLSR